MPLFLLGYTGSKFKRNTLSFISIGLSKIRMYLENFYLSWFYLIKNHSKFNLKIFVTLLPFYPCKFTDLL